MTRIIAGSLRGRRLVTPKGSRTRPTSDRVRESMFAALQAATDLDGANVLDLFAGTGAVGIEAVSRGAAHALLIESHAPTAALLRRNIAALGIAAKARVLTAAVPRALAAPPPDRFDLVFADPPYALDNADLTEVLTLLVTQGWLAEDADVIVERSSRTAAPEWPDGLVAERSRRYGESTLWYGRGLWTRI